MAESDTDRWIKSRLLHFMRVAGLCCIAGIRRQFALPIQIDQAAERKTRFTQRAVSTSALAGSCICFFCQIHRRCKERSGLAYEKPRRHESVERRHRAEIFYRANDRAPRKLSANENAWLGHYQVGLEERSAKRSFIEVRKHEPIRRVLQRRRIASFVLPGLEVHRLARADAEQDQQDLRMGDPLRQRRIETGAALLDQGEMERRRVGDGLEMVLIGCIGIGSGDRLELPLEQTRDRRRKYEVR